jgi:hypothetical protein
MTSRMPCHVAHRLKVPLALAGAAASARAHARPPGPGIFRSTNRTIGDASPVRRVDAAATITAVTTPCTFGAQHRSVALAAAHPNAFAAPPSARNPNPTFPSALARLNSPTAPNVALPTTAPTPASHSAPRSRSLANLFAPRSNARGRFIRRGRSRANPNRFIRVLAGVRALRCDRLARRCTVSVGRAVVASSLARVVASSSRPFASRCGAVANPSPRAPWSPYAGSGSAGSGGGGARAARASPAPTSSPAPSLDMARVAQCRSLRQSSPRASPTSRARRRRAANDARDDVVDGAARARRRSARRRGVDGAVFD